MFGGRSRTHKTNASSRQIHSQTSHHANIRAPEDPTAVGRATNFRRAGRLCVQWTFATLASLLINVADKPEIPARDFFSHGSEMVFVAREGLFIRFAGPEYRHDHIEIPSRFPRRRRSRALDAPGKSGVWRRGHFRIKSQSNPLPLHINVWICVRWKMHFRV